MKNGWQKRQLGELAELKGRIGWRGLTAKEYTESGPLFLSVHSLNYGDYVDFRDAFHISDERYVESPEIMLQEDDVLICKDGAGIGKVGIVGELPDRVTINSSLLLIRSGDSILPKFLYRSLSSPYFQQIVNSRLNGATTPHLYQRDITEFPIVLPPLAEQRRIVSILDEAFEGIGAARANVEKNLQNARSLFEGHLQSVFSRRGDGWTEKQLREMSRIEYGYTESASAEDVGPKFLRITDIQENNVDWASVPYCLIGASDYAKHKLANGDIVFARTGATTGKSYLVVDPPESVCASYLIRVQVSRTELLPSFVNLFFQTRAYWDSIRSGVSGSAQGGFNATKLGNLAIPFPRLVEEQQAIVARLNAVSTETRRLEAVYQRKLKALEALKTSFLHQAFAGELTGRQPMPLHSIDVPYPVTLPGITRTDLHAGVLAMAFEQHEKEGRVDLFTHVKAEKIAHMVEAHLGLDLGRSPVKDAAGPNDFPHLIKVEHRARKANYFDFRRVNPPAYHMQKLRSFNRLIERTRTVLGGRQHEVERLLAWMVPMNVEQAEIVATVFAAWNNLLLDGKQPTDDQIIVEARENWHPDKLRIDRPRFFRAVKWLREQGVVPEGKGKRVGDKGK